MSSDRSAQLVEAGIWLKLSGDWEGARKLFERALKLDPQNEKAASLLAGAPAPGEALPAAPRGGLAPTPPPVIPSSLGAHPFERPEDGKIKSKESDWGSAARLSAPVPEPSLEDDWGRLTGSSTPVPVPDEPADFARYTGSASNVVLGATPAPFAPKATLQFGPSGKVAPARTMQLFPPAPPEKPSRTTLELFGPDEVALPPPEAKIIEISGDPGPEPQPASTPPLFGYSPPDSQVLTAGGMPTPSPDTTPLLTIFKTEPPAEQGAPSDPRAQAWAWSSSSPPAREAAIEIASEPRPSPSLAPRAESAWDLRSDPGIKLDSVAGEGRALDLISSDSKVVRSPEARKDEIKAILRGARDLLELDDHSGAMELIVKAHQIAPDDPDVLMMRERSEKTLLNMFESKLGKLETIPRVLLKDDEIIWLNLDHRAGFVLAQIDGTVSFDDLFSVSGMSRIDTARILAQLVEEGVISRG